MPPQDLARRPDAENVTLLHWAAINNRKEISSYLLDRGADVDAVGGELQSTPLHWAVRQGHVGMVVLLSRRGADPAALDGEGCAAAHLAAQFGFTAVLAYLVARGVDVDARDRNGMTPLAWAAYRCTSAEPARLLLTLGASPSLADSVHHNSPLHWACLAKNVAVIGLLMTKAPTTARLTNGRKEAPLDIVEKHYEEQRKQQEKSGGGCNSKANGHQRGGGCGRFPGAGFMLPRRLMLRMEEESPARARKRQLGLMTAVKDSRQVRLRIVVVGIGCVIRYGFFSSSVW